MADHDSMNASEAAGKMLTGEHADVLCEAVRLMLRESLAGYEQAQPPTSPEY
jgi:hypothetical protein